MKGAFNMAEINIVQHEHFDSIHQFLATINSRRNNNVMRHENCSETGDSSFTGTKNYEGATELITKGWAEVLPRIKEKFDTAVKSNRNGSIDKRRTCNSVVGYAPNVPNAILGLPQSMIYQHKEPQKVKVVSIVYAPDANCGTSSETFIKAGIVVLNIINRLELNGIRVRLMISAMDTYANHTFVNCTINVKDYREQLDLKKLAFPIANPSMLRRFGFKWLETYPELKEDGFSDGYGRTISGEKNHKDDLVKGGIIKDTDYYMSLGHIEDLKFDVQAVMKAAGITI